VQAGFHYSYALSVSGLATSYAAATDGTSRQFTMSESGDCTIYGRIFGQSGLFTDYTTVVQVNDVNPMVNAPANLTATQGIATIFGLGSFSDPGANDGPWTVVVNWGDATTSTFTSAAPGALSPTHTFATTGTFTAVVTVTNQDGLSASGSTVIAVSSAAAGWVHVQDSPGNGHGFLSTGWSAGSNGQMSPLATGPFPNQVAIGDYVFVFVSIFNQSNNFIPSFSCTDNAQTPNTYVPVLNYRQGQQTSGAMIFGARINSLPSSGHLNCTVSWTNVAGNMGALVCASEFSGGSLNLDGSNGTSQGDYMSPAQTGSITTTVSNDLILTIEENDNTGAGATMSTPPGFTTIGLSRNGMAGIVSGAAWQIVNSSYSANVVWDTAPNDTWSAGQIALKPPGSP
jgi:hypothetical protein